eukprot:3833560-Prymnesium_polylepis.1
MPEYNCNMNNGDNRIENLKYVKESEARKLLMEFEEGEEKRYQIVTILPNGGEQVNDRELHGWDSDTADITESCYSFWQMTGTLFQVQAIAPTRLGLKVVQVGTEKMMARLQLNPPDEAEKKCMLSHLRLGYA